MKPLEELFQLWHDGSINEEDLADLKSQLGDPAARSRFAQDLLLSAYILESFRLEKAKGASGRKPAAHQSRVRPVWLSLAASAAAAILIAVLWFVFHSGRSQEFAELTRATESSLVRSGVALNAAHGTKLLPQDRLTTATNGACVLKYPDGTSVTLDASSSIELQTATVQASKQVFLVAGSLLASVVHQPTEKPMVFVTPNAAATVLGTELKLSFKGESTRLEVTTGRVRLAKVDGSAETLVQAGSCAIAATGVTLQAAPLADNAKPASPAPAATTTPRPKTNGRVVYSHDFTTVRRNEGMSGKLVRLKDGDAEVTAIVSCPFTGGHGTWNPDVVIGMFSLNPDGNEGGALYRIPPQMEIRFRIKSDKTGRCSFNQQPATEQRKKENFFLPEFEVGPEWKTVIVKAKDLTAYRTANIHTPDLVPGLGIAGYCVWGFGFGTSCIYLDSFEVISAEAEDF